MKTKPLFILILLVSLSMVSCRKEKDNEPQKLDTIKIGDRYYPIIKIGLQT